MEMWEFGRKLMEKMLLFRCETCKILSKCSSLINIFVSDKSPRNPQILFPFSLNNIIAFKVNK